MVNFCKCGDCPTSAELLEFEIGELPGEMQRAVRHHLADCEFCRAEIEFYSRYPQIMDEEVLDDAVIPAPLFELAEALLKHRSDPSSLDTLLRNEEIVAN